MASTWAISRRIGSDVTISNLALIQARKSFAAPAPRLEAKDTNTVLSGVILLSTVLSTNLLQRSFQVCDRDAASIKVASDRVNGGFELFPILRAELLWFQRELFQHDFAIETLDDQAAAVGKLPT